MRSLQIRFSWKSVSLLVSLAVLIYVIATLDWLTMATVFSNIEYPWLAASLIFFFLNYVLRTIRFKLLTVQNNLSPVKLFGVTSVYGMLNYLLPAKIGELSYLLLIKRLFKAPLTESTATLIIARVFDVAIQALLIPIVLVAFFSTMPPLLLYSLALFSIATITGTCVFWSWLRNLEPTPRLAEEPDNTPTLATRIKRIGMRTIKALHVIQARRQSWRLLLLTIGIWLLVYANFYFIVASLGFQTSLFQIIVISIILVPLTLLPVQGIANLGAHEIAWVTAFSLFGSTAHEALIIAVGTHVILIILVLLLGLVGISLLILNKADDD